MQPLAQLEPANELNTGNLSISGESERQFTKKAHGISIKIIQALVVVVSTLFFFEGLARVIAVVGQYDPLTSDEFLLKQRLAETPTKNSAIVFMGSSFTSASIYADILASQLQKSGTQSDVKNLAMQGQGAAPAVQLKLLRRAIDSGNKPSVVLCDVSPLLGCVAERLENHQQLTPFSPYLLVYRARFNRLLRGLPGILAAPSTVSTAGFGINTPPQSTKGWNPILEASDDQSMAGSLQQRQALAHQYRSSPQFFKLLEPLQALCLQEKIPLVLVYYPTTPESDAVYQKLGIPPEQFVRLCTEMATKQQVHFINLHAPLDRTYFADCDHVNAAGAVFITQKMLQLMSTDKFQQLLQARTQ